jgi:hypothetical protein
MRSQLNYFHNRLFQSPHSLVHVLNFVQTIEQRGFPCRMRVVDLLEPFRMTFRPGFYSQRRTLTGTQQELRQVMATID